MQGSFLLVGMGFSLFFPPFFLGFLDIYQLPTVDAGASFFSNSLL